MIVGSNAALLHVHKASTSVHDARTQTSACDAKAVLLHMQAMSPIEHVELAYASTRQGSYS